MQNQSPVIAEKWLYLFIAMAAIVNLSGLFVSITGPDGTLYASIAKTMALSNNFVDLYAYGKDWLDKPHFPFWVSALSFKVFGINTWAYKLPAIMFLFMGAGYTYKLGKTLYNKQVGLWAVLILLTAQHIILSNNDVRAEPYLTGLIIAAVYHLYKAHINNSYPQIFVGCLFTACAIMTKGMFAIVPIGGAFAGHFIITKQWRSLFHYRWLVAIVLVFVLILPELYCLYEQFDAHPEKVVFDRQGVSGIRFFFWDSQFGRFFNTGPIKGHGDPSFFVHTTLWAFLPWSILLFVAIFRLIKTGIKAPQNIEWYCLSASLSTFVLFSASRFQLPHYINIVFPFFAIITAQYLYNVSSQSYKAIKIAQNIVIALLLILIIALHFYYQPETLTIAITLCLLALVVALVILPAGVSTQTIPQVILRTLIASFIVNIYLNTVFYTSLLKYQAGSEAAMWINANNPDSLPVVQVEDDYVSAMNFYIRSTIITVQDNDTATYPPGKFVLYATSDKMHRLAQQGYKVQLLKTFDRYWISRLKPSFLNKNTRQTQLSQTQVALVSR